MIFPAHFAIILSKQNHPSRKMLIRNRINLFCVPMPDSVLFSGVFMPKNTMSKKKKIIISLSSGIPGALILAFFVFTGIRFNNFKNLTEAPELSKEEQLELSEFLQDKYSKQYQILKPLPYNLEQPELNILAESAILIDLSNGNIIYEKNADEVIPPASMTKLFAMYVVDQEVSAGRLHYDDIIPLPEESFACNMPPHSSLMFLGENQVVTLNELLLGLCIASGNDAAYALAYTVSGSMEAFIERMNKICTDLNLTHTHFVESSGYSEENTTTAREMATFCRVYLSEHPESLEKFHSVREFTYPKKQNMAPGDIYGPQDFSKGFPRHITMGITQKNTNPLLDIIEGCDGLKTGYIDESGYNLALTAKRNQTRFLSITMKGPGKTTKEGQNGRIHDGTELMDFAFGSFADFSNLDDIKNYFIKSYGTKSKGLNIVPAFIPESICVPFISGNSILENLQNVKVTVELPEKLFGEVTAGTEYGKIHIKIGDYTLQSIPLVADRSILKGDFISVMCDKIICK